MKLNNFLQIASTAVCAISALAIVVMCCFMSYAYCIYGDFGNESAAFGSVAIVCIVAFISGIVRFFC
jgi:hypothetical protein